MKDRLVIVAWAVGSSLATIVLWITLSNLLGLYGLVQEDHARVSAIIELLNKRGSGPMTGMSTPSSPAPTPTTTPTSTTSTTVKK